MISTVNVHMTDDSKITSHSHQDGSHGYVDIDGAAIHLSADDAEMLAAVLAALAATIRLDAKASA